MNSALRLSFLLFAITFVQACQPAAVEPEPAAAPLAEKEKVPPPEQETKNPPIELAEYSLPDCQVDGSTSDLFSTSTQPAPGQLQSARAESAYQKIPGPLIKRHPYLLVTAGKIPEVKNLLIHWDTPNYVRNRRFNADSYYRTYNSLMSVLKALENSDRGCRAAHLLSAHFLTKILALRIPWGREPADWDQKLEALKPYGVTYSRKERAMDWESSSRMYQRAVREYTDTGWGEFAFSRIYEPDDLICPWVPRDLGNVESFLKQKPESRYRRELALYLAQKYETHWSFSHASPNLEDYEGTGAYTFDPDQYEEGAEEARTRAINWYEEFLNLDPYDTDISDYMGNLRKLTETEIADITESLRKLKAGIDTEQWKKNCFRD